MLILNKNNIDEIFTMKDAVNSVKKAYEYFSLKKCEVPLRTKIVNNKQNAVNLFMSGHIDELDMTGIKIVSVFPNNAEKGIPVVPATMVLLDSDNGQVCSIMDGTYLTQLRTGAATGVGTDVLSRKDSKIAALFGVGGQSHKQLEAMLAVRDLELIKIFDINKDKAKEFEIKMNEIFKGNKVVIKCVDSSDEAVINSDIITVATTSNVPVFDGRLVKKGAHINGIGSYTPIMQEIDEYLIKNAGKIYVDSIEAVLDEAGDLLIPISKGIVGKEVISGEIGEVISGKLNGRENEEEITIFKSVGIAAQDIVTSKEIFIKAKEKNIGMDIASYF